jgi:hypothetical protein
LAELAFGWRCMEGTFELGYVPMPGTVIFNLRVGTPIY